MSDAAISTIANAVITVVTTSAGVVILWIKLRYSANKAEEAAKKATVVEEKIDANTVITKKIEGQTNGGLDDKFANHAERISALENKVNAMEIKVDTIGKNVDSTRHEMRGHFQTVMNLLASRTPVPVPEDKK